MKGSLLDPDNIIFTFYPPQGERESEKRATNCCFGRIAGGGKAVSGCAARNVRTIAAETRTRIAPGFPGVPSVELLKNGTRTGRLGLQAVAGWRQRSRTHSADLYANAPNRSSIVRFDGSQDVFMFAKRAPDAFLTMLVLTQRRGLDNLPQETVGFS